MSQYAAIVGDDETTYALDEKSTGNLETLQTLRMHSTALDDQDRRVIARRWAEDADSVFEDEVRPPEYYRRAFQVVAAGFDPPEPITDPEKSGSLDEEKDVRFDVVEVMVEDFLPSGSAGQNGRGGLFESLQALNQLSQAEETRQTE